MADSQSKRDQQKKKLQKQKEKALKKEEKKLNNNKGKSLEEMIVYVDMYGRFTDVPPHLQVREEEQPTSQSDETKFSGVVSHFNEKGYGFIKEDQTNESVFFHQNQCIDPVKLKDKVVYLKENSPRGMRASHITKQKTVNF